jgi:GNAT superfamily N-acetyltransferase
MSDPPGAIEPTIHLATLEDVPELARLRWELYAEQEGAREPLEAYRDRFVGFAVQALATDRWRAWVARGGAGPVGSMWLQTVVRVPVPGKRAGPIGYLTNAYVSPEHRNRGLGARMLEHVTGWCRDQGYSCLITWPSARSRPFYRRGGFDRLDEPFTVELVRDEPV